MAENPPEYITFIHTADLHLGRPFDALGPRAEQRREDLRATFRRLVERATQENVDLFLVAGDLFDSPCPPPADRETAREGFRRLKEAGIRTFAIPGTHDFFIPDGVWSEIEAAGVAVFSRPRLEQKAVPELGVKVYGMAFDRERPKDRPLAGLQVEGAKAGERSLFLFHGSLDVIGEGYDDAPFSEAEIAQLPFAYVALGHYHSYRQMGRRPPAVYPGSPEGIGVNPRGAGERYILLGRLEAREDETAVHLQKVSVGGRRIEILNIDLSQQLDPESLFEAVRNAAGPEDLLGLHLTGAPSPEVWEAAEELEERFAGNFFHFRVDRSHVAVPGELPDDDRFILGRFCNKLKTRIENAEGEERSILEMALRLGVAAANRPKSSSRLSPLSVS